MKRFRRAAALLMCGLGLHLPDAGTDRFYDQILTWTACPDTQLALDCTDVTVPVDWSRPQGGTITLRVHRQKASGASKGSLLLNPGGPGQPGKPFLEYAARRFSPPVIAGFDLVSFDPRGIGESAPLTCPADADAAFQRSDPSPDMLIAGTGDPAALYEWGQSAAAHLENGRLLTRVGIGHGSYVYDHCRPEVDRYLLEGTPPPRRSVCAG